MPSLPQILLTRYRRNPASCLPSGWRFSVSFFLPGLGQLYKGQLINGIVWFVFVSMGYVALVVPGLILHFFCVLGASSGNPWSEGTTTVVRE